ncbi:MAG: hypothetical protein IJ008_04910 [Clostridia bacterium]|nr:hypothetical protein [Clostridia bacterium]
MDLNEMQKRIYQNKLNKGFNTSDINLEFCLLNGEVAEAFEAYIKKKDNLGSELADVAIYLMGLSELLGISLEDEINKKVKINEEREYVYVKGVLVKKGSEDDIK